MKRLLLLLMIFVLACPLAHAETTAQYKALTNVDFGLRKKPEESSYRYLTIPEKSKVKILEWGEEWCLIEYQGQAGYAKTKWLYHVQSLDALHYPLPNMVHNITGYVVFNQNLLLSGGGFNGLNTVPGQIACVDAEQQPGFYSIPIWRNQKIVTGDLVTYHPFTDWREASSGDIIGGFTTFYGEQQGKGKAENREHNILLACERINDTLIEIDASFSFNELCAPYKKYGGYKIAPNVSQDGEGYGGGVCQVTTTLYNAVLTLPLQITDWAIHRYNGVSYVPQFFDAAVGTYSDFVFTNTLPYAIKIKAIPQNGMLTVLIYCT